MDNQYIIKVIDIVSKAELSIYIAPSIPQNQTKVIAGHQKYTVLSSVIDIDKITYETKVLVNNQDDVKVEFSRIPVYVYVIA